MRDLNEIELKVLRTASEIEKQGRHIWRGPSIQFAGWPEVSGYQSKKLGISAAISYLVKRGFLKRYVRSRRVEGYMLTDEGKKCL